MGGVIRGTVGAFAFRALAVSTVLGLSACGDDDSTSVGNGGSGGRGGAGGGDDAGSMTDDSTTVAEDPLVGTGGQVGTGESGGQGGAPSIGESGASGEAGAGGGEGGATSETGGTGGNSDAGTTDASIPGESGGAAGQGESGGAAGQGESAGAAGDPVDAGPQVICAPNIEDSTATIQEFDAPPGSACVPGTQGTSYACDVETEQVAYPGPQILAGAHLDPPAYLRLLTPTSGGGGVQTSIAFESTSPARPVIVADFDFRVTPEKLFRADGFGFALLDAQTFPAGPVGSTPPCFSAEEPNFDNSVGVGFDVYRNSNDLGDDDLRVNYSNAVSVHYVPAGTAFPNCDLAKVASTQVEVGRVVHTLGVLDTGLELVSTTWNHARVILEQQADHALVTLRLTGEYGQTSTVVDRVEIPVPVPYSPRVWFGARAGGESSTYDIANVRVHSLQAAESGVAFSKREWRVDEAGSFVDLEIVREGASSSSLVVQYFTQDRTAVAGQDYETRCGEVRFGPGESTKSIRIHVLDDQLDESSTTSVGGSSEPIPLPDAESFTVSLSTSDPNGRIFGPSVANVTIVDDEAARSSGSWGPLLPSGIVAVHAALLPTGKLLLLDRLGNLVLSQLGGQNVSIGGPGYDAFCNGAAFLEDGKLLVSGGHDAPTGAALMDGVGVVNNSLFDPVENSWLPLPEMNEGRWYPTVTTLSDGTALLLSGSYEQDFEKNPLPQVYLPDQGIYRDLVAAEAQPENDLALGYDLYPRVFALPNAKVIKVGPDPDTWILDTNGDGGWVEGPTTIEQGGRIYGPAVLRNHQVMLTGGGSLDDAAAPTDSTEELDLDTLAGEPAWAARPPLFFARRQHNATVLPDGRVLVTNGCQGPGFSDMSTAVLPAEMFTNGDWQIMPASRVPRCYHSVALLLADGSILIGGGGQGAALPSAQNNFEIYYPDYFYRPRPSLSGVPAEVHYGAAFNVTTSAPPSRISVVRLGAVTHSFDQNQRFAELPFTPIARGASVTAPNDGWLPPGHYVLFVLDQAGVPSVGELIRLTL